MSAEKKNTLKIKKIKKREKREKNVEVSISKHSYDAWMYLASLLF